ncbi:MAG: lycopene cyclase, partial [Ilumatobacter sp.]|nr:lycopene cyclase [Ilumatobacter sp.]
MTDVVVIGDGPAGSALAAACRAVGVDALLVGADDPWTATYGVWADDLDRLDVLAGENVLASRHPDIHAWTHRRHRLARPYGVIDNEALRRALRATTASVDARVDRVDVG